MLTSKLLSTLQKLIKYKVSQQELANILGVHQTAIAGRIRRDSEFSELEIMKIEKHFGIDILDDNTFNDITNDTVEIDYISIKPSCGTGAMVLDDADVTPVKVGCELIKNLWNSKPENLKLFKASGDSMEETISDNNVLLVDVSKTDYHNGGIYILQINNDWFCKRLRLRLTGELDIISDNNKYPIETLKPDTDIEIKVIGKVIKNLSKGL